MNTYNCIVCNKESIFKYQKSNKFCSIKCQMEFKYLTYIERWKNGLEPGGNKYGLSKFLKRFILTKFKNTCGECGIDNEYNGKPITLEIDHIDGNPYNNLENNLRVLCPNCHSQSSNYKNRNKGKGRSYRIKYKLPS